MCHNNDRVDLAIVPHDGLPAVTSHHFTLVFTVNRNVMVSVSDTVSTTMVARLPVTGFLREVACRQKAYDEAHQLAQETVMLNNSIDDRFSKAMALHTLGLVAYALELALNVLCHPATGQEAQRRSPRTCALNWKRHSPPSRWPRRNDVCAPETFLHWSKNN
jgi:hypothetical protein